MSKEPTAHSSAPTANSQASRRGSPRSPREWRGLAQRRPERTRSPPRSLEPVERLDIDCVETLANTEQEDADDNEGDKHRECDRYFNHQRHSPGAGSREDQPVLQRHEANDLADGIA